MIFGLVSMWTFLFEHSRIDRPASWENILCISSLLVLLLPLDMQWWQTILSVSFGVVIGEQIFGGRGYSFISPVIAALAFQLYSFTNSTIFPADAIPIQVILLPILLLLFIQNIDWRALLGIVAGYCLLPITTGDLAPISDFADASQALVTAPTVCLIFIAADGGIFKKSHASSWIYGALIGGLQYVFDPTISTLDKTVFACFLGFVAAPLIDWTVFKTKSITKIKKSQEKQHVIQ